MGALVSATALGLAVAVVPAARRFATREELLDARRAEIARLRGLIHDEASLRQQVAERAARARSAPRRVLSARTAALAAADLQAVLRGLAASAPLAVSSLDVSGEPDSTTSDVLPASLSALGDVQAVTTFLASLRRGPFIMSVSELRVRPNSALRGQPLQLSLTVRAPWLEGDPLQPRGSERGDHDPESARLAALIVASDIFSDSRRPPSVRYNAAGGPQAGDPADASPASSKSGASARFSPQLFGVLGEAQGPVALLRLDPRIPGARLYHVRDEAGGYRVVRIAPGEVDIEGPGGRRTLRLANPRPE